MLEDDDRLEEPSGRLLLAAVDASPLLRFEALRHMRSQPMSRSVQDAVVLSPKLLVRLALAANPYLLPEVSLVLADDERSTVRTTLARHTLHQDVLVLLTTDVDEEVVLTAALNVHLPPMLAPRSLLEAQSVADLSVERVSQLVRAWGEPIEEILALLPAWPGDLGELVEASRLLQR